MKKYNIAQIGTFDVKNYGDLLFPIVLKELLNKNIEIDNIFLFSPNGGSKPFDDNTKVYKIELLEDMHLKYHFDAIIIGGGDLIRLDRDVASDYSNSYKAAINIWQMPIIIGRKYNVPVIFNALGVPFEFNENQKETVKILCSEVDYVAVRDNISKKILEGCGVERIKIVPDSIMLISDIYTKQKLVEEHKKLVEKNDLPLLKNIL